MALLTCNFTAHHPLSDAVQEAISTAFHDGWADTRHISQQSHRAAILKKAALDQIGAHLGHESSVIHIVGEPSILPFLSIQGFLQPDSHLYFSEIDQGKVRAVVESWSGAKTRMAVSHDGAIEIPHISKGCILHLQSTNGETGIRQNLEMATSKNHITVIDATHETSFGPWIERADAVTLDSYSWGGPAGLGFLILNSPEKYSYPIPHIAPINVPGSYSLPLLIGAATALDEYINSHVDRSSLRDYASSTLSEISGITVIDSILEKSPHKISFLVKDRSAEELLHQLNSRGIHCDAGSACSPSLLSPSQVLRSMGYETQGHIRLTLNEGINKDSIDALRNAITGILQ